MLKVNFFKPFFVFAYQAKNPYGGWGDFDGSFDTLNDAISNIHKRHERYDLWEIIDARNLEVVWKAESERSGTFKNGRVLRQTYPF